ncbi:uncharacterized protein ColSpa_12439 [Colletotrichum spaethianum]|uniref:Uncharacterized protein n=1 Tax=Colletotrichum spaethianum TaxID=700344 RepID=A0AA37PHG2_9PEZI|nr:uncharacterized protein ColSpa_12439 [Colletotrichum spaethianum]GKT52258.1 hypothetical protein ColSpa_12439 [Colletotrichum spaethianum]
MASVRTIASLALALGVAAIPAPAPIPEAAPALVDDLSQLKVKVAPFSLSLLPLQSSIAVKGPDVSIALPSIDVKSDQGSPTAKLLPRVTALPNVQLPKIPQVSTKLDGLSLSITLPDLSIPSVAIPTLPPIQTPALPILMATSPTSLGLLLAGTPIALPTSIPRPSTFLPEKPTTLLTLVPAPSGFLTCATILCREGYVCRETEGRPACVSRTPCGNVFCPYDTSCCNASCSVCTPKGVMCTQQSCGHLPSNSTAPLKPSGDPGIRSVPVVDESPQ